MASLGRGVWPFSAETAAPAVPINLAPHAPSDTVSLSHKQRGGEGASDARELQVFLYKRIYAHLGPRNVLLRLSLPLCVTSLTHADIHASFFIYLLLESDSKEKGDKEGVKQYPSSSSLHLSFPSFTFFKALVVFSLCSLLLCLRSSSSDCYWLIYVLVKCVQ